MDQLSLPLFSAKHCAPQLQLQLQSALLCLKEILARVLISSRLVVLKAGHLLPPDYGPLQVEEKAIQTVHFLLLEEV